MLATPGSCGGPIIWPLRAKLFHPVFLQQRPCWTGGLQIQMMPALPWDNADMPPVNFSVTNRAPIADETLPTNFGLAALGLISAPLVAFLHPQRPRANVEQTRTPAVIGSKLPATFFTISGITKDSAGAVLGNCTLELFETGTDRFMEKTTSNGSGYYYFKSPLRSASYYVVAYKAGSPDVAGTTVNTLAGA